MEENTEPIKNKYVFGPVPSRRLGRSLGIDLVPYKTCTFDCIYCQLGVTTCKTMERGEYAPLDDVLSEFKRNLAKNASMDFITLSGSGEPTLYSRLGELISAVKKMSGVPLAVLTNGSLLWDAEVRNSISEADVIIPSLDAGDESLFRYVNRPHEDLSFDRLVSGLRALRMEYDKQIWLEVFLLSGVTALESEVEKIAKIVGEIKPDKVQLNTVARPAAEEYAVAVPPDRMRRWADAFGDDVEVISGFHGHSDPGENDISDEAVTDLIARRPCSPTDVANGLGIHRVEALKRLEEQVAAGKAEKLTANGGVFYTAANIDNKVAQSIQKEEPAVAGKYLDSCKSDFWRRILQFETNYILKRLSPGMDVLSVGCGPAIIEGALAENGMNVTGLDISNDALASAPETIETVAANADDMPFPEARFDAVLFVASLQFIGNHVKAVEEAARVLRPGGLLISMQLNPESEFFRKKRLEPDSYIRKIAHESIGEIQDAVAARFDAVAEYTLCLNGDSISECHDTREALLHVVSGTVKNKKEAGK